MEALVTAVPSLVKLLKYEWALDKTVKDGLTSLEAELRSMQALLEKVSSAPAGELDRQVKLWAGEVRELSYDIETHLHSFMVRIESTKGTVLSGMRRWVINHDIASYIKETKIKIIEVSERRQRYSHGSSSRQELDPRIYALTTKEPDLVGLAGATDELDKMLSKGDNVSILGMGGLGKTTLARAVYDRIKDGFDFVDFVQVGRSPDAKKILKGILYQLDTVIHGDAPDEGQLIDQLRNSLTGKRFLIVIDDIWDEETWALINSAFAVSTESTIITTTRILKVAQAAGAVYVIKPLSQANSQELLNTKIFGADAKSHDTEFSRLSDKILSKCGGVPIAIITIARLLAKKPREEWSKVYDSIGFGEQGKEGVVKDIRTILSFSYYDLPYHLQRCLLYLSLFPEGHWIQKNMLIWRWVAEGLVPSCNQKIVGSFELGESYFDELIDRSMIQWAVSPRDLGQGGCRIHDMMLDLIRGLSSSENENFSTVIGMKQDTTSQTSPIHRLAIHNESMDEIQNTSIKDLKVGEVLSFYASTCAGSSLPPLSKFARLRVIDLEDCDLSVGDCKLQHIGKLAELGYVGLLGTPVAKLPKTIGRLKFLQTLDVTETGIKELPPFVCELKNLRCLRAGKGTRMMGAVGELMLLEELWLHSADKSPDLASELGKLTGLRVLVIHFDEKVQGMQDELVESLSKLKKLQVLQVWFDTDRKVRLPCWEESVPFPKLRQLLLFGVVQSRMMPWIHYECVEELTKLLLEVEVLDAQDLQILGQMPSLCSLYLHSEDNSLSYTAGKDEFKVLEYLYTNIELICGDGALPMIQDLEVRGIRVGTDVGLQGNMPLLERASYHLDCRGCSIAEVQKAEAALWQDSKAHPNRPTLSVKRWNNIGVEIQHHIPEVVRAMVVHSDASRSPVLGGGGKEQAYVTSMASSFLGSSLFNLIANLADRSVPFVGLPLMAGDGTRTSSRSQEINGDSEGQIRFSTDSILAFLNSKDAADALLDVAARLGYDDPATLTNMVEKHIRNPEIVASINSMFQDVDVSPTSDYYDPSVVSRMTLALMSDVQKNQIVDGLETAANFRMTCPIRASTELHVPGAADPQGLNDQVSELNDDSLLAESDRMNAYNALPLVAGRDPDDFRNLLKKAMQNPKFLDCMKSLWPSSSGPEFASESSTAECKGERPESGKGTEADAWKQPSEHSGAAGLSREPLPEVDSVLSWLSTPDGASLRGQVDASSTFSALLSNLTLGNLMVDLTAQPGFMNAEENNASVDEGVSVVPESTQDCENFCAMLNKVVSTVEQPPDAGESMGQPSSKVDNVGLEEGTPSKRH